MNDDSPDISDLSFDQKIAVLEEELPKSIRDFLHSPARDATSLALSQKYRLHADQAAAFERAYLYMLIGVNSPHDFVQDLKDAGIDLESIKGLTSEINEQVFKKLLRQEFHEAEAPKTVPVRQPAKPQVPVMQVASAPPMPTPPQTAAPAFNLATQSPQATPVLRTMQSDMTALQHGSIAAPYPVPNALHPAQATPARMFQTASVPVTAPSVTQSVPEMVHLTPDASKAASTLPPIKELSKQSIQPVPKEEYGSDPYREPI